MKLHRPSLSKMADETASARELVKSSYSTRGHYSQCFFMGGELDRGRRRWDECSGEQTRISVWSHFFEVPITQI